MYRRSDEGQRTKDEGRRAPGGQQPPQSRAEEVPSQYSRPSSVSYGLSSVVRRPLSGSRIAIGIRRAVAAVEPHLMRAMRLRPLDEKFRIERDSAFRPGVELHHPAVDSLGIELRIDRAVERVGEIDPLAVAADLDHLRAAVQRAVRGLGMSG